MFCQHCGSRVLFVKDWIDHYEKETGDAIYHSFFACVNWRWYSRIHFKEEFEGEDMVLNYDYI